MFHSEDFCFILQILLSIVHRFYLPLKASFHIGNTHKTSDNTSEKSLSSKSPWLSSIARLLSLKLLPSEWLKFTSTLECLQHQYATYCCKCITATTTTYPNMCSACNSYLLAMILVHYNNKNLRMQVCMRYIFDWSSLCCCCCNFHVHVVV